LREERIRSGIRSKPPLPNTKRKNCKKDWLD